MSGMNRRLRRLLFVLREMSENGKVFGRTKIQKMVFLVQHKRGRGYSGNPRFLDYDFVLYYYGPFSSELFEDLERLVSAGYLRESFDPISVCVVYELTEKGLRAIGKNLEPEFERHVREIVEEYNRYTPTELAKRIESELGLDPLLKHDLFGKSMRTVIFAVRRRLSYRG